MWRRTVPVGAASKRPWEGDLAQHSSTSTKRNRRYDWPVLIGLILLAVMLSVRQWVWRPNTDSSQETAPVQRGLPVGDALDRKSTLTERLSVQGIAIELQPAEKGRPELWFVYGRPGDAVLALHRAVRQVIEGMSLNVVRAVSEPASGQVTLEVSLGREALLTMRLIARGRKNPIKGRIAFLIDDFGAHWNTMVQQFAMLDIPMSISVIPSMKQSGTVAREMGARGCELLLHMPMEPFDSRYKNEPMLIQTSASAYQIRRILDEALRKVPGAVGVNNHMGSKATSHRETMTRFLKEVSQKRLYFVDSRTISSTVAFDVARELGVPCTQRQVFLDSENTVAAIQKQMRELARMAHKNGQALAIGHCRRNTLTVLKESIPRLKGEGFEFVFVSQLTQ